MFILKEYYFVTFKLYETFLQIGEMLFTIAAATVKHNRCEVWDVVGDKGAIRTW